MACRAGRSRDVNIPDVWSARRHLGKAGGLARDWTVDLFCLWRATQPDHGGRVGGAVERWSTHSQLGGLRDLGDPFQPLSEFANRARAPPRSSSISKISRFEQRLKSPHLNPLNPLTENRTNARAS